MAKFIGELIGIHGRRMKLYDTKCVITFEKTAGSFMAGSFTDGEKTIFLKDVVGVQYKKSGVVAGYLQFETPSMQMHNASDNMFSENTFIFEDGKNGITNNLMDTIYNYVVDRIEELKYGQAVVLRMPVIPAMDGSMPTHAAAVPAEENTVASGVNAGKAWQPIDKTAAIKIGDTNIKCANCDCVQFSGNRVCKRCGAKFIKKM